MSRWTEFKEWAHRAVTRGRFEVPIPGTPVSLKKEPHDRVRIVVSSDGKGVIAHDGDPGNRV